MNGGGITIPERGIIVDKGVYRSAMINSTGWNRQLLQHEFGHILQYKKIGPIAYYSTVAPESLASATFDPKNHSLRWMETWANYLSMEYFGSKYISNAVDFPVQNISQYHQMRIKRVLWKNYDIVRALTITF